MEKLNANVAIQVLPSVLEDEEIVRIGWKSLSSARILQLKPVLRV